VLMADMFGSGYANKTKARPELAAAVGALHGDPRVHHRLRQRGLRGAFRRGKQARSRGGREDSGDRLLRRRRVPAGTGAHWSRFQGGRCISRHQSQSIRCRHTLHIKGRVLAIHGSVDPVTPKPKMDALVDELAQAKVDWQVMMIGGMLHELNDKNRRKAYMLMRDFSLRRCELVARRMVERSETHPTRCSQAVTETKNEARQQKESLKDASHLYEVERRAYHLPASRLPN